MAGLTTSNNSAPTVDGKGQDARFAMPLGLARDSAGVLYVTDEYGVRKIAVDGTVSFLSGSPTAFGVADGSASVAKYYSLSGIAVAASGDVFVSDLNRIRRVDTTGTVSTYGFGDGAAPITDGPIATARFLNPGQLLFGPDGALYVIDTGKIRKISPDGQTVSTLAGPQPSYYSVMAIDSSGTLYYGGAGPDGLVGLRMRTAAGVDTLLIPQGPLVLGAAPVIPSIGAIAVYGPKQLVIHITGSMTSTLLVATLP